MSTESLEVLVQIRNSIKIPSDVLNKAKLFDEEVHKVGPAVASKMVKVLVEFGERMEKTLFEMRGALQGAGLFPDVETGKGASHGKGEIPVPGSREASPIASEKSKGKSVVEEKTPEAPKAASRLDIEIGKGVIPGSKTKGQARTEDQDQETSQSKVSGPFPKAPSTIKKKATAKRAREEPSEQERSPSSLSRRRTNPQHILRRRGINPELIPGQKRNRNWKRQYLRRNLHRNLKTKESLPRRQRVRLQLQGRLPQVGSSQHAKGPLKSRNPLKRR